MKKQLLTVCIPTLLAVLVLSSAYSQEQAGLSQPAGTIFVSDVDQATTMINRLRARHPNAVLTLVINGEKTVLNSGRSSRSSHDNPDSLYYQVLQQIGISGFHISLLTVRVVEIIRVSIDNALMDITDSVSLTLFGVEPTRRCVKIC